MDHRLHFTDHRVYDPRHVSIIDEQPSSAETIIQRLEAENANLKAVAIDNQRRHSRHASVVNERPFTIVDSPSIVDRNHLVRRIPMPTTGYSQFPSSDVNDRSPRWYGASSIHDNVSSSSGSGQMTVPDTRPGGRQIMMGRWTPL